MLKAEGSAWYDGVQRCRARICPVCWIARRAQLAQEINYVVGARECATRRQSLLCTLTIRHSARDPVSICRTLRRCWSKMISGREWVKLRDRLGLEWIAAEEITLGPNGWHPHIHVLLLPGPGCDAIALLSAECGGVDWWFERWHGIVARELGKDHLPEPEHGADLRPCSCAAYLTKLGLQLTDSGAVKGRAPLALLQAGELASYVQLQLSRHRARDFSWSKGLRAIRARIPKAEHPPELVLRLRGSEWGRLAHEGDLALLDVLQAAERGEGPAVAEWWLGPLRGAELV